MNLPFDLTLFEVIFIAILLFIGSAVQGILGFGFAVIASPIIVQIEPNLVPQLLALLGLPLALRVFYREKDEVDLFTLKLDNTKSSLLRSYVLMILPSSK